MTIIRIQEHASGLDGPNAIVSFDYGPEYPITIHDPFSQEDEKLLEWYFEEHMHFPFNKQVFAEKAATSVTTYGEVLFNQVFANREVYALYKECVQADLNTIQVEIAGSPEFHRLHWETLKDPQRAQPLALQATMVRKNLKPQIVRATVRPSPTINVLVVTARPSGKGDVGYRTISRPLVEELHRAKLRVQIDILRPGTYKALDQHLRTISAQYGAGYYHVIHFDVHGAVLTYDQFQQERQTSRYVYENPYGRAPIQKYEGTKAFLFLEGEQEGKADPVEAGALANLLINHYIPIVILNACQSGKQVGESETSLGSKLIQEAGVQLVLAMGYSVTVSAAELLMHTLYEQLFVNSNLPAAIRYARQELYNRKERRAYLNQIINLEDWLLPIVYQNQLPQLSVRPFTAEEAQSYHRHQAARYKPRPPHYGFFGRDLDILQIEKRLLTRRNILLLHGMGGAGKTTLLHYLGEWWQTTGFIQQVFYFGYDEQAWTRQQIVFAIAQRILGPEQYTQEFLPLPLDAQQEMLTSLLRSERHLLILDNLESIAGTQLAIQHTLPPAEQTALHSFLSDLSDGHTIVLLGSRSNEPWLAKATFSDNVYELLGLDPEAASRLADRVLEKCNATKYRGDADLQKLLKILDGFPLALEVVLANLARQTPGDILAALQAGDVKLDKGDSQKKTESILYCIDYSHSNLSSEAQDLLLCLAPFTLVIREDLLDLYTSYLQQQPHLATLAFERWPEVIQEARNWGLLGDDPTFHRILRLQPSLSYFLRTRLHNAKRTEIRHAVETAFWQFYDLVSHELLLMMIKAKDSKSRPLGSLLVDIEYENLLTALRLGLAAEFSIFHIHTALAQYLGDVKHDHQRCLDLSQMVLQRLEAYTDENRNDRFDMEIAFVIENIAKEQIALNQYDQAKESYQKELTLILQSEHIDEEMQNQFKATIYAQLGSVAKGQRQWERAEQYYLLAQQIDIASGNNARLADNYFNLGDLAQKQSQWPQAEQYYQQSLQFSIDAHDHFDQAEVYSQLGIVAMEQGLWVRAEQYYQQALQFFTAAGDFHTVAKIYINLGKMFGMQKKWTQAEYCNLQALEIFVGFNDRSEQARIYHNMGAHESEHGQYSQAEHYFLKAHSLFTELNDHYHLANTSFGLGLVAQEQKQWDQAQHYYLQALPLFTDLNDRAELAKVYFNLGIIAQEQAQWSQVEHYYLQALPLFIDLKEHGNLLRIYSDLGLIAQKQKQWPQAEHYYLQALPLFTALNDPVGLLGIYTVLSGLAQGQAHWSQAEHYYLQALPLLIDLNEHTGLIHVYVSLGLITQEQEQWSQAQHYYLQALPLLLDLNDHVQPTKTDRDLNAVTSQREQARQLYEPVNKQTELARVYFNLGFVTQKQVYWSQAEHYYLQALPLIIEINDRIKLARVYFNLGLISQEQVYWSQAQHYYLQALPLIIEINDRADLAHIYLKLGHTTQKQEHWSLAEHYYLQALPFLTDLNEHTGLTHAHFNLGLIAEEQEHWPQAEHYYLQALPSLIDLNDRAPLALIYRRLGFVTKQQNQWTQAEQYFEQALPIYVDLDDRNAQAVICHELGVVNSELCRKTQAEQYCHQALKIYNDLGERHVQGGIYQELGNVALSQEQWTQAQRHYEQSLQIYSESNDLKGQAGTYDQLGSLAQERGQWNRAEQYYQQALQIYSDSHDLYAPALTYLMLGNLAMRQKRSPQAEQYYQKALQIFTDFNDYYSLAKTGMELGSMFAKQEKWTLAQRYLLEALKTFMSYNHTAYASVALYQLATLWQNSGDVTLPAAVASVMGLTPDTSEDLLHEMIKHGPGEGARFRTLPSKEGKTHTKPGKRKKQKQR